MLRFVLALLALTTLLLVSLATGAFGTPSYQWEIVLYSSVSTALIYFVLQRHAGALVFTQYYLLTIVCKMLVGCIFIGVVLFVDRPGAAANAVLFIVSYLLFTALEVGFLYYTVRRGRKL